MGDVNLLKSLFLIWQPNLFSLKCLMFVWKVCFLFPLFRVHTVFCNVYSAYCSFLSMCANLHVCLLLWPTDPRPKKCPLSPPLSSHSPSRHNEFDLYSMFALNKPSVPTFPLLRTFYALSLSVSLSISFSCSLYCFLGLNR